MPASIEVRELRYQVTQPGFRTRQIVLVTTLLDAVDYPVTDLAQLYFDRWRIEVYQPEYTSSARFDQLAA